MSWLVAGRYVARAAPADAGARLGDRTRAVSTDAMRFPSLVAVPAIAVVLVAAPSHAQDASLFGLFRSVCTPGLDAGGIASRATAQGFVPAKKTPKLGDMKGVKAWEKTVAGREFFVVSGHVNGKPRDGLPASFALACGAGVKGKDEAGLAAGRKCSGVPTARSMMGVGFHAWRQDGGRKALDFDDKPAMKAALAANDLNILTVSPLGGVSMLMLTRSRAAD